MWDYHDIFLKFDILSLGNVFEKFKNNSLKNYRLRPNHCLSAPALSWDTMLDMKKVELELFSDADIICSLKKVWEVEFITFLRDIVRLTKNIWNLMNQNISYT